MSFGNIEFMPHIISAASAALLIFTFYLAWKKIVISGKKSSPLPREMILGSPRLTNIKNIIIYASIFLAAFVLMKPRWGDAEREAANEGTDLLVALDVSLSMLSRDTETARLDRAKQAVKLIAQSLTGDRIGLALFSGDSFLQCPFTSDIGAFMTFLDAANPESIRLMGTDIGGALKTSALAFRKKRLTSKILILISDGEDHEDSIESGIAELKELGVRVYAFGIGFERGEQIPMPDSTETDLRFYRDSSGRLISSRKNSSSLKKIASETGGAYYDITESYSGINAVIAEIEKSDKTKYAAKKVREPIDRFPLFAGILALLLLAETVIPERGARKR